MRRDRLSVHMVSDASVEMPTRAQKGDIDTHVDEIDQPIGRDHLRPLGGKRTCRRCGQARAVR